VLVFSQRHKIAKERTSGRKGGGLEAVSSGKDGLKFALHCSDSHLRGNFSTPVLLKRKEALTEEAILRAEERKNWLIRGVNCLIFSLNCLILSLN